MCETLRPWMCSSRGTGRTFGWKLNVVFVVQPSQPKEETQFELLTSFNYKIRAQCLSLSVAPYQSLSHRRCLWR